MAKKSRVRKIIVKIASEELEKVDEGEIEAGKEAKLVGRFFIPMLKPFQLQPLPIGADIPKLAPGLTGHNIKELRQLLSDEKARILSAIKNRKPVSLYHLAKMLGRDFKAVRQDVKLLEKIGFIKLVNDKDKKTKKKRLKPVLALDKLQVTVEL